VFFLKKVFAWNREEKCGLCRSTVLLSKIKTKDKTTNKKSKS
jgi:hypothetical protein